MNNAWDYRGTMIRASLWAAISGDKVTISALRMIWPISYGPYDMDLIFCIIPFIGFYRLFEFKGHLRVFEIFWTPNPRIVSILIVFIVSITLFEYWLWYPLSIVERQTLHHNICHEYYCILLNGGASFRWEFGRIFAGGSTESTAIFTTHPSLQVEMILEKSGEVEKLLLKLESFERSWKNLKILRSHIAISRL